MAILKKQLTIDSDVVHHETDDEQVQITGGGTLKDFITGLLKKDLLINGVVKANTFIGDQIVRKTDTTNIPDFTALTLGIADKPFVEAIRIWIGKLGGYKAVAPTSNKDLTLGTPSIRWEDAWIGDFLKEDNGHTRIFNGMTLQWGSLQLSVTPEAGGGASTTIDLPIPFPTKVVYAGANCNLNVTWNNTNSIEHINTVASIQGTNKLTIKCAHDIALVQAFDMNFRWIALGW